MFQRFLVLGAVMLLTMSIALAKPHKLRRLQTGMWGGSNIRLNVERASATVEYGCADGTINGPLMIDSKGRFNWTGSHNQQHPGPTRIEDESSGRPAVYSGWVKGDTMTLTVKLRNSEETIGTFTLKLNGGGRVFRCK
jgi:hypothetical protein